MGLLGRGRESPKFYRTWKKKARACKGGGVGEVRHSNCFGKQAAVGDLYSEVTGTRRKKKKSVARECRLPENSTAEAETLPRQSP